MNVEPKKRLSSIDFCHDLHWLEEVLQQYDMKFLQVHPIGPYRCRIDGLSSVYEGRLVPSFSAQLRRFLTDYVSKRGFRKTQRFIYTIYHEPYLMVHENLAFYLTDGMYENPFVTNEQDLIRAMTTLSSLHTSLAGAGLDAAQMISDEKQFVQKLEHVHRTMNHGLQTIQAELLLSQSKQEPGFQIAREVLNISNQQAHHVLQILQDTELHTIWEKAEQLQTLAWNGLKIENFHYRTEDPPKIDLEQVVDPCFASPIFDLSTVIQSWIQAHHIVDLSTQRAKTTENAMVQSVQTALLAYHQNLTLSSAEWRWILAIQAYPWKSLQWIRNRRRRAKDETDTIDFEEQEIMFHQEIAKQFLHALHNF